MPAGSDLSRQGAVDAVSQLVSRLDLKLVPYTVLLIVPLLKRMSDPVKVVRDRASACFGSLVALLPLAQVRG